MREKPRTNRVSRLKPTRTSPNRRLACGGIVMRLAILVLTIALIAVAAMLMLRMVIQNTGTATSTTLLPNPSLNPLEAAALGAYLALNRQALTTPASDEAVPITFTVEAGQNAAQIAENLRSLGLIRDTTLFRYYLRYYGLDVQIEAGAFDLNTAMTIPQIALALTEAKPPEVTIRITEGWRREQIADYLDEQQGLPFGGTEFLAATAEGTPLPPDLSLAAELPAGASLEGFLFPDTYRVALDATASDLVEAMLRNFDRQVTAQMRTDAAARGLTLYEVVTLASIVEREAVVPDERPLIASVYLNRLAAGMKLEADPTVQYAMGYQAQRDEWWNLNLTQQDYYTVDSPYNTYLYAGLPPGPIANPGLASIQAVIYPAQTPYFYFRATCDGSGRHYFSRTFEEHQAYACP